MTGRDFEALVLERFRKDEADGRCTVSRYGVQVSFVGGEWKPIKSYPDFEGVLPGGRQFIVEAKVCRAASFPLDDDKFKNRQYRHMIRRANFGVISILLVHFPQRELVKRQVASLTVAYPVYSQLRFWEAFDRGEVKRLTRMDCAENGIEVFWTIPDRCRKATPDVLAAIEKCGDFKRGD